MLEAQCSIQPDSDDGVHLHGDIIVVALAGHPWGTRDKIDLVVAEWNDQAVEDALTARRKAGEEWPVISYPYAEYETDPKHPQHRILVHQSTQTIDLDSAGISAPILRKTPTTPKSVLTAADDLVTVDPSETPTPTLASTDYSMRDDSQVPNIFVRAAQSVGAFISSIWSKVVG